MIDDQSDTDNAYTTFYDREAGEGDPFTWGEVVWEAAVRWERRRQQVKQEGDSPEC